MILENHCRFRKTGMLDRPSVGKHADRLIDEFGTRLTGGARSQDPLGRKPPENHHRQGTLRGPEGCGGRPAHTGSRRRSHRIRPRKSPRGPEQWRRHPLISEDLDEIFQLSDRVAVMYGDHGHPRRPERDLERTGRTVDERGGKHMRLTLASTPSSGMDPGTRSRRGHPRHPGPLGHSHPGGRGTSGSPSSLFRGALGTRYSFLETCVKAAPLTFTGLAAAFCLPRKILEHRCGRSSCLPGP